LVWSANVTLNSPNGNEYLSSITVGFHQTAYRSDRSLDADEFINDNTEGNTYLDTAPGAPRPWYAGNVPDSPLALIDGRKVQAGKVLTIQSADSPTWRPIVQYGAAKFMATSVKQSFNADLSVAAQTSDNGGWTGAYLPNTRLFQEASAKWSVNADGTIATNGVDATGSATWTPDKNTAGVKPPPNGWVVDIAPPTSSQGLLTKGSLANQAGAMPTLTFGLFSL
jgi:hypothetical protein